MALSLFRNSPPDRLLRGPLRPAGTPYEMDAPDRITEPGACLLAAFRILLRGDVLWLPGGCLRAPHYAALFCSRAAIHASTSAIRYMTRRAPTLA